ncbi:MAG: FHA domain-containing protein [Rhizonema sp. PD38]|nr:FHA domain-containing protein [Rhizonema sp. PD38]
MTIILYSLTLIRQSSRLHCVLEQQASFWRIVDESSANGTFVQQGNSTALPAISYFVWQGLYASFVKQSPIAQCSNLEQALIPFHFKIDINKQ